MLGARRAVTGAQAWIRLAGRAEAGVDRHFEGWRRAKEQRLDADFRALSGRFVMAAALKHVPIEAERNCGRLRYDLLTRIEQSVNRFAQQLAERIRLTLESIRRAIAAGTAERAHSGEQAAARQAVIDGQLTTLATVDARLDEIRTQAADL